ncbi:MAG TPA: cytochrome c [Armatimonadota bacterium]|nr:cytochrome c [Armatimonadota bacterium]
MPPVRTEQERNVRIVLGVLAAVVLLGLVTGGLLYMGVELPPYGLRSYYTASDGYAAPANPVIVPPGTVARGSGMRNTDPGGAPAALDAGRRAYAVNCAMCHGEPGRGPGPVGESYVPPPPDVSRSVAARADAQLYQSITRGIRSTPTAEAARYLPETWHAFPEISARERWAVVRYLRTAFGAPPQRY